MLPFNRSLPTLLALAIALQPALVSARTVTRIAPQSLPTAFGNAGAALMGVQGTHVPGATPAITSLGLTSTIIIPQATVLPTAGATAAPQAAVAIQQKGITISPTAAPARKIFAKHVAVISRGVTAASNNLPKLNAASARPAASRQFAILTNGFSAARPEAADLVPVGTALGNSKAIALNAADETRPEAFRPNAEPASPNKKAAAPKGFRKIFKFKIFKDPERNKAYWRWFLGEQSIMVGFYMYMVALPFYMQSFTGNLLREAGAFDSTTKEQLAETVRQNRALARIAHWAAQGIGYLALPFFTRGDHGPRRWMVRSAWARTAMYGGIFGIFYGTGLVGAQTALYILLGLIAGASFFQGIAATMSAGASARIMGDKTVTKEERKSANSMRSFVTAIIAIIAPLIAGQILGLGSLLGKDGGGGALIYGIYAATVGVAGLIFASIKMLAKKKTVSEMTGDHDAMGVDAGTSGFFGTLKGIGKSMMRGVKLVWSNRFLRTMVLINLAMSLFTDPLIFNALPQYVAQILASDPGATSALGGLLGFFIDSPGGLFALLITSSSIGTALAAVFAKPLDKFLGRWFKTEEALTIPYYILAALSVPAFWAMINFPSVLTVLGLYGLQTLLGGFVGLTMVGIYQKNLGSYSSKQMNQVLAASSFLSIIAAIASTYAYGFLLVDVPLQTMLTVAAIATTVAGALRLAAPWLMFTKQQRKGAGKKPKDSFQPKGTRLPIDSNETPDGISGPLNVRL
ncbi:MAG: hypothetical protein COB53_08130 [Elusimicrobia bacterium]|nr:MAG: hypothetical protein COB53_08130 [Elusimicrobiota bacterium]